MQTPSLPLISLCMIVKNEEAMLPACLESVRSAVDEIVILDTGSTDRTIEIAEQLGARVIREPWASDFSLHRNHVLSHARGQWILQMDADERLSDGCRSVLRKTLAGASVNTSHVWCLIHDYQKGMLVSEISTIRLFRNGLGVHYQNPIHEQLIIPEGDGKVTDIAIEHFGYDLSEDKLHLKFQRNYELLKVSLEKNPEDLFTLYYMAVALFDRSPETAMKYGETALRLLQGKRLKGRLYINLYYIIAAIHMNLGRLDLAEKICQEAVAKYPEYVDAHWILADIAFRRMQYDRLLTYGRDYLTWLSHYRKNRSRFPGLSVYSINRESRIHLMLAITSVALGQEKEALSYTETFLAMHDSAPVAAQEALALIDRWGLEPTPQEAIISLFYRLFPDEEMIAVLTESLLSCILDSEPSEGKSVLEERLPILTAIPELLSEVNDCFYRTARDDLLAVTADCDCARLPEQLSPGLVVKITKGDMEKAVREINLFLNHVGFPVHQDLGSAEEFSVLLSELADQRRLAEDPKGASIFQEAGFLLSPRKDRLESMIDAFMRAKAFPRIKKYLTLGVHLGFLDKGDLRRFRKEVEAWSSGEGKRMWELTPAQKNIECSTIPIPG